MRVYRASILTLQSLLGSSFGLVSLLSVLEKPFLESPQPTLSNPTYYVKKGFQENPTTSRGVHGL